MGKYRILRTHNYFGEVVYVPQYLHHGWFGERWKSYGVMMMGGSTHRLELDNLKDAKEELKKFQYQDNTPDKVMIEEGK